MKLNIEIQCSCGNKNQYNIKYDGNYGENFFDLSSSIDDEFFIAKPTPEGTWMKCKKCNKRFDII